jgi:hypothetical protein
MWGAAVCSFSDVARAEPSAADKSLATQLFKEGRALVDQGETTKGCRKLEESQRLDPGGGTLLNVALCHEKEGRTATAWAEFTEALGLAKRDDRAQRVELAEAHITALEPLLSRLIIEVPPASDLPDLEIRRDGGLLRRAAWGTGMPVDPGEHQIEASSLGKTPWKQTVVVGSKSDVKTVSVPRLENAPSRPAPLAFGHRVESPASEARTGQTPAGWVALGLGAAGVGVATYFGLQAMSEQSTSDGYCTGSTCTAQAGVTANERATRAANLATVGAGVGLLGLGLGTFLLLTAGPSSNKGASASASIAPAIDKGGAGVFVNGNW